MTPPGPTASAARARRARRAGRSWRRLTTGVAVVAAVGGVAGWLAVAYLPPAAVARIPGSLDALDHLAAYLPARVAWAYDRGSPRVRPGVYLGWSDGVDGELHLYGRGCSLEGEGDSLTSLRLSGPTGSLELDGSAVEHLRNPLDRTQPHPHLRLRLATERSLDFDRVSLRCRSGAEASARIAARVVHVTAAATGSELFDSGLALLTGPVSLPSVGVVGEMLVGGGNGHLTVTSVEYAPPHAGTGELLAAFGRHAHVELWRSLVYPPTPGVQRIDPSTLTPWDAAFQPATDPGTLRRRPATTIDLPLGETSFGILVLDTASFAVTPHPRPILVRPVVTFTGEGGPFVGLPDAVAFGWTTRNAGGW